MILIDTSAWVEFLRGTGSATCQAVHDLLGGDIAICDPVRVEVLAAAAIEARTPILHADSDFDVLARHTPLQVVSP